MRLDRSCCAWGTMPYTRRLSRPPSLAASIAQTHVVYSAIRLRRPFLLRLARSLADAKTGPNTRRWWRVWMSTSVDCFKTLAELGLDDNTIVVFTSDNGGLCTLAGQRPGPTCNLPWRAGKGWLYEGGIRVACLIRWPSGLKPAVRSTCPATRPISIPRCSSCANSLREPDAVPGWSFLGPCAARRSGSGPDGALAGLVLPARSRIGASSRCGAPPRELETGTLLRGQSYGTL